MTYPQLRGAYAHVSVTGQRLTTCGPEARDKHDATLTATTWRQKRPPHRGAAAQSLLGNRYYLLPTPGGSSRGYGS
ncbi:uncharacterized protein BDR25DRAFT_396370 [Lindgomyces ingoldianus]|uniref:Uncharacterized protein n=1 Tax=Lindgomyces ingoldianus TaxID=673940 RepID=A0ACB6QFN8_9PLEO|nr:uncharacterized protein BDR25DRAFT_396370 [Lindgomyces ingoldianus]KAF2465177.1 hypothetical protein BDR25DRAFT_396370 [Lindgomyces ingoldianus]